MKQQYLLAIDAGTGSIRAVLFNTQGEQIAIEQQEWTHIQEEGVADSMGFDFQNNWEKVCSCIRNLIVNSGVDAKAIVALSATSMREGIVLYDAQREAIWGVANVDARAADEVHYLKKHYPDFEYECYMRSGQTFALGALPRLLWLKKHRPQLYEKTASLSMIGDWILAKLCGKIASDPSNGGTTGVFDLKSRKFAVDMAKKIGIKGDIFPPVFEVGEVLGCVTQHAAQETGLSCDTLVVMGGGDVQLGSAGLGVVKEGDVAVLGGSFWQQVVNIKKTTPPPKDISLRVNPHVIPELSQAEGISFFSGLVMRWFRDAFCAVEKQEAKEQNRDVYEILEEKAQKIPVGSYDILPIFSDVMHYGKWYHSAPSFLNLGLDSKKYNPISMFRALEENTAIVASINLENIKAFSGVEFNSIVFAGGASKGELWAQILADVTGYEVKIPKVKEATALGAAMAAGVGAGVYENMQQAALELVSWEKSYKANLENKKIYDKLKIKWQEAYKAQLGLVDEGVTNSMWMAPGI